MLASTCGRMTSIRPYRMSLNNCCQLLQDRRAGQVLLGGYRHGQPMAVLLLDQPQFVQGGQAGQGLACVFRPRWAETIGPLRPVKIETSSAASTAVPTG